jgi:hypothetical protein
MITAGTESFGGLLLRKDYMKMPEFIPFHFDKFNQNLFRKHGAIGVGRWCLIRKAVAETPTLTINLNDISDRETLELDSGCSETELSELLDYAAQRGMIDAQLYGSGILWIENLDTDLGRFFTTGKRHLPKRPQLNGKIPVSSVNFVEKFQEVEQSKANLQEKFHEVDSGNRIPTHETKRNETKRNEESPTPLNFGKKEVKFIEHPPKQDEPKPDSDEDGSKYIEELTNLRKAMAKFIKFYGKEGNPSSVEQELRTASSEVMKRKNMTFVESLTFILHKADDCRKYETDIEPTELKFRKKPENWLSNNCWENQYGQDWENGKRVDLTPAPKSQIELEVEERARIRRMDERLQAEWEQEQAAIERGKSK